MKLRLLRLAIAAALLVLAASAHVRAGDETCYSIPVTSWSPSGVAGCTLDGPTDGVASWWHGNAAAANWCTYPWTDCGWATVQSHQTGVTITVHVGMFCGCWTGTPARRLIDLTLGQLRALGLDPTDGLYSVTVTPIDAPATSASSLPPSASGQPDASPAGGSMAALPDTAWTP